MAERLTPDQSDGQTSKLWSPRDPFYDDFRTIDITPQQREIGMDTYRLFTGRLKRLQPWFIKLGDAPRIEIVKSLRPTELEQNPLYDQLPNLKNPTINLEGLEKEVLPTDLVKVLRSNKTIEDKLADYMGRSDNLFREYHGISRSYSQWGNEEGQHSDALALILDRTGNMTFDEGEDIYYENLARTWELPFPTPRQMVAYAAFQEQLTSLSYEACAKYAKENGALITSEILTLISHDEAYHGGGYRQFLKAFYKVEPQETYDDTLHVARNFRMPAQNLLPDTRSTLVANMKVGSFSKSIVTEGTIYKTLIGLGFISEPDAKKAANEYGRKVV